jgi:PKD repeat protein
VVTVDLEGQATGQGTLGDPFLGAFDSGCNLIALNDDNGVNLNSRLVVTIPADGILVLGVTRCCDSDFNQGGSGSYRLTTVQGAPPPVANFGFNPFDPSVFDVVQFFDFSFDPGGVGIASQAWDFGDGATGTGPSPTHQYAADGDYTVQLTVTTFDGRTASTSQTLQVRTHDVAITKFTVPKSASAGQTRAVTVGINSRRSPESVEVQLFKSVPGGFQFVGSLTQSVPVRPSNRTTNFDFSYTFTADDARVGKVTFKAVANIVGARDALPADNEAIASPTKVSR